MADDVINGAEPRVLPRTLAGATVLQIARTLADSSEARAVVDVARALVLAGARAIVAAGPGALVEELKSFGGEWAPIAGAVANPIKLSQAAEQLATYIAAERIDIVHAKTLGSVRCARAAAARAIFRLVADLPDWPDLRMRAASLRLGALAGADRIIARSLFLAQPLMRRHGVALERVSVIPRSVDTAYFNPVNLAPQRITALRQSWGIPSGMRIVLVPGRVSPANGQMTLVEAARLLAERGMRDVTFVFAGDDARHRLYVRKIVRRAQAADVYFLFRFVGHCTDMPAAYAAADVVVLPAVKPPMYGRAAAEAQVMARPVIAAASGPLPENILAPPRIADDMRTGWLVRPNDPDGLADALATALAMDTAAYRAMAARARDFGEFMFSPKHAAVATLDVYTSLLSEGG